MCLEKHDSSVTKPNPTELRSWVIRICYDASFSDHREKRIRLNCQVPHRRRWFASFPLAQDGILKPSKDTLGAKKTS